MGLNDCYESEKLTEELESTNLETKCDLNMSVMDKKCISGNFVNKSAENRDKISLGLSFDHCEKNNDSEFVTGSMFNRNNSLINSSNVTFENAHPLKNSSAFTEVNSSNIRSELENEMHSSLSEQGIGINDNIIESFVDEKEMTSIKMIYLM